jgi:hypothetical protein
MKLTPLQKTDSAFSKFILKRDKHTCQKCRKPGNQNSHFFKRARFSVRFDPLNCVCLCGKCHSYFGVHPTEHTAWFKTYLGISRFAELTNRAYRLLEIPKKELIEKVIKKYKK